MLPTPTASPETGTRDAERLEPLFHVILLDDDDHTYDYVVEMLGALFFLPLETAYQHAVEVDTKGRTIVITCELPHAEFARVKATTGRAANPTARRSPSWDLRKPAG